MKMLKKFIFILTVAVCAASCMKDGVISSYTYQLGANFEGYGLLNGTDSLYFEKQLGIGMAWHDVAFYHKVNENSGEFMGGFMLSNLKSGGKETSMDRYRVNSGNSSTYLVFYQNPSRSNMPEHAVGFLMPEFGTCTMRYCYVNNTKEVVDAVKKSFVAGDTLAVKMTGYLAGKKTVEQKYILAAKSETKDSLVTKWSPINLSKFGSIEFIDIEMVSTNNAIPKAFCMDDMNATISIAY